MEKRLHNTRHAARQARNSTGRVGSSSSNSNTTSGVSTTTAEKTTTTTASTTKAEVSVPRPSSEPTSNQYQPEEREQPVSPSARYRPQQFCGRQGDSTDEEVEEMEDDAKSPQLAAPTSPAASAPATPSASAPSTASPEQMYEGFQAWALRTYGDSAKTKTVTRKKYQRILKILRGEEQTSAENSKFRFWVKAKGFKTGLPQGHPQQSVHRAALLAAAAKTPPEQLLFVPCSKVKKGGEGETTVYKRVAVVENFFEIIYGVHVEMDGRGGKHAGQKRTYKAIAELYAFLPREAVTHFLMSCSDCQKRMHLTNGALSTATVLNADSPALNSSGVAPAAVPGTPAGSPGYQSNSNNSSSNNNKGGSHGAGGNAGASCQSESGAARDVKLAGGATAESSPASSPGGAASEASSSASTARAAGARIPRVSAAQLDFSVPITTAYLKHMRSLGLSDEDAFNPREDSTLGSDELSEDEATPNFDEDDAASPDVAGVDSKEVSGDVLMAEAASTPGSDDGGSAKGSPASGRRPCPDGGPRSSEDAMEADPQQPLNMTARPAALTPSQPPGASVFAGLGGAAAGEHGFTAERAMAQSPLASTSGGAGGEQTPDDLSAGTKEEDEEDDDDEQDKLDISSYDPERLKAFNMFVRLFVDENLDRMVPISRQPKEKIQAIIDSCGRQFPEFAERARKRIRTYLKSCRRTKRTRDLNGWDMELDVPVRPTTPGYHVTLGVGSASGGLASVPSSVSTSVGPVANNVSSQLISRLTSPIVTASNGQLSTSSALMPAAAGTLSGSSVVSTTAVDTTTVCPFHMHHHHHQQQFHQHFTSSANSSSSNGTLSSAAVVTSSPVTSFMNGGTTVSPHTHHHHKCTFNSAATTNGVGLNSAAASTPNGHHYHVHHRHANSSAATALGASPSPAACNSPTDLSVKKCNGSSSGDRPAATMALKYSLNPTEVNAVKQLIAGYRESAAFLLRSADELEQLLLQQN
ncbi:nucleolar protein 4-like isoform X2 [Haemaphysalis longicornis]